MPTSPVPLVLLAMLTAAAGELPVRLESGPLSVEEFPVDVGGGTRVPLILPRDTAIELRVYVDTDENGAWDEWDPLVPARRVTLRRASDGALLATTSSLGGSRFSRLTPGRYVVTAEDLPRGLHHRGEHQRTVEVVRGQVSEVGFAMAAERSISGRVWVDVDRDGRGGPPPEGEVLDRPARGVVLFLSDGSEAVTDELGRYRFDGLAPGLYEVMLEYPSRPAEVMVGEGVSHRQHVDFALPPRAMEEIHELRQEEAALLGGADSHLVLLSQRVLVEPGRTAKLVVLAGAPGELPRDVSEVVQWRVEDPGVVRVEQGVVLGVEQGSTRVRAEVPGVQATEWIPVEVSTTSVVDLRVRPEEIHLFPGGTAFLEAPAILWDGRRVRAEAEATWSSMDPTVVEVDGQGVLHALRPGTTEVYAEWQGVLAQHAVVHVLPGPE